MGKVFGRGASMGFHKVFTIPMLTKLGFQKSNVCVEHTSWRQAVEQVQWEARYLTVQV